MKQCPCGSNQNYDQCCGLYINDQAIPQTPEALMRSRYTAYSLANIGYIIKTMQGKPLTNFDENEAQRWASNVIWLGLNVVQSGESAITTQDEQTGFVEFIATYLEKDALKTIHENSQFQRRDNRWFYIDGQLIHTMPKKIFRNAVCPCGSQKKFKNCHAPN